MLKNKNILVTGGAGFIGSHLVDRLVAEEPNKIIVLDNLFLGNSTNLENALKVRPDIALVHVDASCESTLRQIVAEHKIEVVFNLAVVPLPTSLTFPAWTTRVNTDIVLGLCELSRTNLIEHLVHFSSSEAYGSALEVPMGETHRLAPTTPYAASKAAGDLIVQSYIETFGISTTVLRPFNNYGPRQNRGSYAGIIPIVAQHLRDGTPIEIHGSGTQTRDFVFAASTADIAVRVASLDSTKGETINVATGVETPIVEIVSLMKEVFGRPEHPTVFVDSRPGDVLRHCGDSAKLRTILGVTPEPINERFVRETLDWYLS